MSKHYNDESEKYFLVGAEIEEDSLKLLKEQKFLVITGKNGIGKTKFLEKYYADHHHPSTMYKGPEEAISDLKISNPEHRHEDIRECSSGSCINAIRDMVLGIERARDSFDNEVLDLLIKRIKSEQIENEEISDTKEIFKGFSPEKQENYIVETWNTLTSYGYFASPTKYFLQKLITNYTSRIKENSSKVKKTANFIDLFEFYLKSDKEEQQNLSIQEFAKKIKNNKCFLDTIVENYGIAESKINENFIKKINKELKDIDFKYRFDFDSKSKKIFYKTADSKGQSLDFKKLKLSSGEEWILGVVLWKYGVENNTQAINLVILDEPDRHLDPKLCKQFIKVVTEIFVKQDIKVIMSTHRIDTVALIPKEFEKNIFTIHKTESGYSLKPTHKLQVMFKMSSNFRDVTNYHHKVYTESLDDAHFYEWTYNSLKFYCDQKREKIREIGTNEYGDYDYYWYIDGIQPVRILSQRCQLSFYPVSIKENASGGSAEVKKAVQRDANFHPLSKKGLIDEVTRHRVAGILDSDYEKDHEIDNITVGDFFILKRHSLENFIFDPFILISCLNSRELPTNCEQIKLLVNNFNGTGVLKIQEQVDNYFKTLLLPTKRLSIGELLIKITQATEKVISDKKWAGPKQLTQEELKLQILDIAHHMLLCVLNKYDDFCIASSNNPDGKSLVEIFNKIFLLYCVEKGDVDNSILQYGKNSNLVYDIVKPWSFVQQLVINVLEEDFVWKLGKKTIKVMCGVDKVFGIMYPILFLHMRGHDIEIEQIFKQKNKDKFKEELLSNLVKKDNVFIPFDLAEVFFELNNQITEYVRETTGKGKRPEPSSWLDYLGIDRAFSQDEESMMIEYTKFLVGNDDFGFLMSLSGI